MALPTVKAVRLRNAEGGALDVARVGGQVARYAKGSYAAGWASCYGGGAHGCGEAW